MEKKNERIFISYKRVDKDRVDALRKDIEQATGEPCWIDRDGIESDAQFVSVIMSAIKNCEIFLFMRSKEHNNITNHSTDWTIREVNYAMAKGKRIVFISLDNAPLPDWFEFMFPQKQEIDAWDATKLERFYADLRSWLKVEEKKETDASDIAMLERLYQSWLEGEETTRVEEQMSLTDLTDLTDMLNSGLTRSN